MLFVIILFIIVVSQSNYELTNLLGLSKISLSLHSLGLGVLFAFCFVIFHLIWKSITSHIPPLTSLSQKAKDSKIVMVEMLPENVSSLIQKFILISLEAGLMEEIFFRGIIQTNFSVFISPMWGVIISAVLFGFAHIYQGIIGMIETFLVGVILSISYMVTGNLVVPIIGHFLGNFLSMMIGTKEIVNIKNNTKNK
jgi:membrane protease YdiL (CAAX protease family)